MHLVVLVEEFYPATSGGGLTRWRFCQLAAARGHDVTVFTPRRADLSAAETVDGVRIRRPIKRRPGGAAPYSVIGVLGRVLVSIGLLVYAAWWLRDRHVDGLHSADHAFHWVGRTLAAVFGVPLVSFVGYTPSIESEWRPTPRFVLERLNFRLFMGGAVLCRHPRVQAVIEEYVDGPVTVLHGILSESEVLAAAERADAARIRERYDVAADDRLLAYVGRLVPIKDPAAAVSVVADLPPTYRLVVVGDGPAREDVEAAITEYGLEDRVFMTGEVPHGEVLELLSAADGLILTSRAESYSAAALEGLVLGCQVFAPPVGVLKDLAHPRLHVTTTEKMASVIRSTDFDGGGDLDEATLADFSMERYTDDVLETFERVRGRSGGA